MKRSQDNIIVTISSLTQEQELKLRRQAKRKPNELFILHAPGPRNFLGNQLSEQTNRNRRNEERYLWASGCLAGARTRGSLSPAALAHAFIFRRRRRRAGNEPQQEKTGLPSSSSQTYPTWEGEDNPSLSDRWGPRCSWLPGALGGAIVRGAGRGRGYCAKSAFPRARVYLSFWVGKRRRRRGGAAGMADAAVRCLRDGRLDGEHAPALAVQGSLQCCPLAARAMLHLAAAVASNAAAGKAQARYWCWVPPVVCCFSLASSG
jgi:hypothetical protein